MLIGCAASDAHSYSEEGCVKVKQCLHLETLGLPAKARFHSVGSRLAHIFLNLQQRLSGICDRTQSNYLLYTIQRHLLLKTDILIGQVLS